MRLTDDWFTALAETEGGDVLFVNGRDNIMDFIKSGKFKERAEVTWKYEADSKGLPRDGEVAQLMDKMQEALKKAQEKNKLSILTGIYVGGGEKTWVFVTRNVPAFGECLNEALAEFEQLPITIYTEKDPDNEEYFEMYEMKKHSIE